jgi:hypothetical protein
VRKRLLDMTMSQVKIGKPDTWVCGRIPTLNQRGFTAELPDPLSQRFIEFAATIGLRGPGDRMSSWGGGETSFAGWEADIRLRYCSPC